MSLTLPERLGIWRLGSTVHCSGAFVVVHAQPVDAVGNSRWDYALKIGIGNEGRGGIAKSIAAGAAIHSPNLVPILDGNVSGDWPYLVMPMLDGKTMKWHLTSGSRKPLPVALWLIRQICQGLSAMHSRNWTHGDVKPENVIVGGNGHVTLIDLAFSHHGTLNPLESFRGTVHYSAPELLVNASSRSAASDIFAAGRILWEWLALVETSSDQVLGPACELVECMVDENPGNRPTAAEVTATLLRLEIDTLGEHIVPLPKRRAA